MVASVTAIASTIVRSRVELQNRYLTNIYLHTVVYALVSGCVSVGTQADLLTNKITYEEIIDFVL